MEDPIVALAKKYFDLAADIAPKNLFIACLEARNGLAAVIQLRMEELNHDSN
jgi:hypothetical protein